MLAGIPRFESVPPTRKPEVVKHTATSVVTIERFIIEQEKLHPEATGELSGLLYDLALAAKMIANKVRSAGLADILGATDLENVQGETQQKLDVLANEIIIKAVDHGGRLCAMASEEEPGIIDILEHFRCGKYCLLFDPLDGSSNIDVNVPVGTIFSVVRKITRSNRGEMEDMLQPGRRQVAAGYVIYGSSTMMVYTTGQGAHGFTLDPSLGEFLLSHPNIRTPAVGRYLSVNDSYHGQWEPEVQALMRYYRGQEGGRQPMSTRYVGMRKGSRLHRSLVRERQVAADASAFNFGLAKGTDLLVVDVTARPETSASQIEEEVEREIDLLVSDGVTADEVGRAMALIETDLVASMQSAGERADGLSMFATYFREPELINEQTDRYRAVTASRVNDFIAERMGENNRASLLYVPKERVEAEEVLAAAAGVS